MMGGVPIDGGIGNPVRHDDFGRKPLTGLGKHVGFLQQPGIRVIVDIHEPWSNDLAACINHAPGFGLLQIADLLNAILIYSHVRSITRGSATIDQGAILYDQVEHFSLRVLKTVAFEIAQT